MFTDLDARRAELAEAFGQKSFVDSTATDLQYDRSGADLPAGASGEHEIASPHTD
ncbi:MAG: hypothetical protein M3O21_03240 [Chloroflexota bacterium]|nr:hypothetical protein [Chloroflexota bacterium]